jgi:hypothetical protein
MAEPRRTKTEMVSKLEVEMWAAISTKYEWLGKRLRIGNNNAKAGKPMRAHLGTLRGSTSLSNESGISVEGHFPMELFRLKDGMGMFIA